MIIGDEREAAQGVQIGSGGERKRRRGRRLDRRGKGRDKVALHTRERSEGESWMG